MSYLVLARKWRPQVFEEVVGQRPITQTLQNAIAQKRVAHAFLFTGPRGVGKTSTARILAKALNCDRGPATNPCNQCTACQEISSGNSMDVIEIDGASNRGIDEIRELRDNVRYTPAKSRYKIYIIDEVHMLTREAFNALLKTLEEPPPHIIFVFATTEPHKIPATILSRCQRYDFKRIASKDIVSNLKRIMDEEKVPLSEKGFFYIARESGGSMRDAQSLLDQVLSYGSKEIRDEEIVDVLGLIDRKVLYDLVEAIANRDPGTCMELVEHVYQYGYDIQHFCRELLQYLRNLILMKVSQHPEPLIELPMEELEALKKQAEKFEFEQLNHLFNLLLKGEEDVAQSTFPRTMLEMTLIRMATVQPVLPIHEILRKLEELEKRADPDGAVQPALIQKKTGQGKKFGVQPVLEEKKPAEEKKLGVKSSEIGDQRSEVRGRKSESGAPSGPFGKKDEQETPEIEEDEGPEAPSFIQEEPYPLHVPESSDHEDLSAELPAPIEASEESEARPIEEMRSEDSEETREEAWRGLIDFVRAKKPVMGSFLALGNLARLGDGRVEIGFEKDSFHYERMIERENRSQLEELCREYFKKETKVVLLSLDAKVMGKRHGPTGQKGDALKEQEKRKMTGEEEKVLIQEALRLFDGKIVER